jgi:hypothetical protein
VKGKRKIPDFERLKIKQMRLLIIAGFYFIAGPFVFAQVAINNNGSPPANSAILDVQSASKGILIPRMTFAQRNAIQNPEDGLILFCTDCSPDGTGAISIFQGGKWSILVLNCYQPNPPSSGNSVPSTNQITWKWTHTPIATGYKWNVTNDFNSATDMTSDTAKLETNLASDTVYTRYVWAYNACGESVPTTLTESTLSNWICGDARTVYHTAGNVAPVNKTSVYGTVTNVPGETTHCWITSNLGSDHQATSVNDASEASAGWYWQFNRLQGYKYDGTTRTPASSWIMGIDENLNWAPTNDPCASELGTGWRIPTSAEWTNVDAAGGWMNWNNAWASPLKLHAAGRLYDSDGVLGLRGYHGAYWSSNQSLTNSGQSLYFFSSSCTVSMYNKSTGFSVRCLRD